MEVPLPRSTSLHDVLARRRKPVSDECASVTTLAHQSSYSRRSHRLPPPPLDRGPRVLALRPTGCEQGIALAPVSLATRQGGRHARPIETSLRRPKAEKGFQSSASTATLPMNRFMSSCRHAVTRLPSL